MTDDGNCTRSSGVLYGWVVVSAICLIVVVHAGVFMSFGVFLNPLLHACGWTHGQCRRLCD